MFSYEDLDGVVHTYEGHKSGQQKHVDDDSNHISDVQNAPDSMSHQVTGGFHNSKHISSAQSTPETMSRS